MGRHWRAGRGFGPPGGRGARRPTPRGGISGVSSSADRRRLRESRTFCAGTTPSCKQGPPGIDPESDRERAPKGVSLDYNEVRKREDPIPPQDCLAPGRRRRRPPLELPGFRLEPPIDMGPEFATNAPGDVSESVCRPRLRDRDRLPGVHRRLPQDGPAGLRHDPGDLCSRQGVCGAQEPEVVSPGLSQSWHLL
ncbi:hypothetical protein BH23PLA1_BH23PLA1_04800 [soil metagenome]